MTRSREDERKRATAARARLDPRPAQPDTRLSTLCIIVGCLDVRVGTNLCDHHTRELARMTSDD